MFKYFVIFLILFFSKIVYSNENLLTVQQQIERLQREVTDLSKLVFSNSENTNIENNNLSNFSAIDMRIRDIEKDINNLNLNLDDINFQIQDLIKTIKNFENNIEFINSDIISLKNKREIQDTLSKESIEETAENLENNTNSLGTLKIETLDSSNELDNVESKNIVEKPKKILSPEDQFQLAMDSMRKKNYIEATKLFREFIDNNQSNQLSGSAYYWLGKLQILEKNFRESVITLAEGHEKFPESIKAPDMLYDLSQSLIKIDKINEACNIMDILIKKYPKNKLINKANKQIIDYKCIETNQ